MWIVIKFKSNQYEFLRNEIEKKISKSIECYIPKIKIKKIFNNQSKETVKYITNDYLFCNLKNFTKIDEILLKLKYLKGVNYVLDNFNCSQLEIKNFIKKCKLHEDENGNLKSSFFSLLASTKIQFLNGPFINQIMSIVENKKNLIKISLNKINFTVKKKNNLFPAVF